jgi:hypothetical protein
MAVVAMVPAAATNAKVSQIAYSSNKTGHSQ